MTFNSTNMVYKNLGKSGLMVPVIGFGTYTNVQVSYEENKAIIERCLQNGINFFDLAESYGQGQMEVTFGKILKELNISRENLVISTKIWKSKNPDINSKGTNQKHIRQGMKQSLKRLQMDYVDIALTHNFDENTPVDQICRGFNSLIQDGMAFYWGMANWDACKIYEAIGICQKNNWHRPIVAQNQYNMFCREQIESEFRSLFQNYKFGLMAYSPLLGGYLTGKYIGEKDTEGRFSKEKTGDLSKQALNNFFFSKLNANQLRQAIIKIKEIAEKEINCTLMQLAIAWVLKFNSTSTTLIGARNVKQLQGVFGSIKVMNYLTKQLEGKINEILGSQPQPRMNFKQFRPSQHLRPLK